MTINNINSLSQPTINGLNNLALNELTADTIYLSVLEVNNIVIDDVLTLNNGSTIIADGANVSCIELSYLDGVTSNIQTQFINTNANFTTELTNLQFDISNNKASIFTLRTDISSNDADIIVLQNKL